MTESEALTNVIIFLTENQEYGDDWSKEIEVLEKLLDKIYIEENNNQSART